MSTDIFLSYSSADRERVRPLVEALKRRGWSVWWDHELSPGARFSERIEEALAASKCVIVAWTRASVGSDWVRAEAMEGLDRHILIPVMLDKCPLPLAFRHQNAAQLIDWTGDEKDPEFQRLLRGVTAILAGEHLEETLLPPPAPGFSSWWKSSIRRAALLVAALALGIGAWLALRPPVPPLTTPPVAPENSIAVLPFATLGGQTDTYRSEGLPLELLALLARVREMVVVSPSSSFALGGDTTDIGRRLNVRYFVEGSVSPEATSTTVDIRLVDAATHRVLWSDRRTVDGAALTALPQDFAANIVSKLNVALSEESLAQLKIQPTGSAAALDQYLRGIDALRSARDEQTLATAEQAFRKAIELDGSYAMPYAGLCRVQVLRYQQMLDTADFTAAESNCRRTLALNALQAEPHKALGGLYLASGRLDDAADEFDTARRLALRDGDAVLGLATVADRRGNAVQAERLFRQAVALEPVYWRTHAGLGGYLFGRARYGEAVTAFQRAIELDPTHASAYEDLGGAYYMNGTFEEALAAWKKALAMNPGATAYSNVGTAYFFLRRYRDAVAMYRQALERAPRDHRWHGNLGDALRAAGDNAGAQSAYGSAAELARQNLVVDPTDTGTIVRLAAYDAALGRATLAKASLEEALASKPDDPYIYYDAAVAWTNMKLTSQALEALENTVRLGYPPRLVAADPLFDTIRATEGFQRIVH